NININNKSGYDASLLTRNICVLGLVVSWIVGIGTLVFSVLLYINNFEHWPTLQLSRKAKEVLPLGLNICVTVLTECLGLIHATALRWALGENLTFNANLRLFTSPKSRSPGSVALGRFANFWHAILLVMTYVSTSLIFCVRPPVKVCRAIYDEPDFYCNYDDATTYLSPAALLVLGVGLVGQAFIATCQLRSVKIISWSSGPINTAWILHDTGTLTHTWNRCMMSVHDLGTATMPSRPIFRQPSAWRAHKEVRRVLAYIWILTMLAYIWFVAVYIGIRLRYAAVLRSDGRCSDCDVYPGPDWSLLPDSHNYTSLADITNAGEVEPDGPGFFFWAMFLMVFVIQAFVTMGLHCAELIVNVSRDEDVWRCMATSVQGYQTGTNTIVAAMKSWKTCSLLALKPVVHWFFGLGMAYYYGWGVFMRPPQILYLAFALTVLALFSTLICLKRPIGPQPATYGHLKTIVDLVDEWHEDMFWGHKGDGHGVAHAGTSDSRLPEVSMELLY
ncbi:hypothetical protein K504DRAFT_341174, partial [Pleomassaria siparia CBS 279.74]